MKSPEMTSFLDALSRQIHGRTRSECVENRICVACGAEVTEFRDECSAREYDLTGYCQDCQDETFGLDSE